VNKFNVVAAGHICLDVLPGMDHLPKGQFASLFRPGQLVSVGPATFSTGGPVSNTGLALFRLGVPTRLMAKVGDDPFGQVVCSLVERIHPDLVKGLVRDARSTTSYSVIVSPPGSTAFFCTARGPMIPLAPKISNQS
jgi:sugar/nucleoside kinase (ribokinase family)